MDFPGDRLGLSIPARLEDLRDGGPELLTRAFHASGWLSADNTVARIAQLADCRGGSTGRKAWLAVEYAKPDANLSGELFVKFSRDFDDAVRDQGRTQMEREVRLAWLSREPFFPIAVPVCAYADYHAASGTGVLVAQRITFGRDGIEPHREKCRDDEMPDSLGHYRALLTALARLAGARLPVEGFDFDPAQLSVARRAPYTAMQLQTRVSRLAAFAQAHPGLLPATVRAPALLAKLRDEVAAIPTLTSRIHRDLQDDTAAIGLCHWNANIDNAWFWRNPGGDLRCGLMDWGCASRMHVAMAIWGALSGADTSLWPSLDELLGWFAAEFHRGGGAVLDVERLKRQFLRYVAVMGCTWLLDAPAYLQRLLPDLDAVSDRLDPRIRGNEAARVQLQMLTNLLVLWESQPMSAALAA